MPTPIRVLIVDDDADFRRMLALMIDRADDLSLVGEATNGMEALDRAADMQPDLILLDLSMPEMGGLEALPELRRRAPNSHVVVFSGLDPALMGERALAAGAHAYLSKGTSVKALLADLRRLLRDPPDTPGGVWGRAVERPRSTRPAPPHPD